MVWDPGNEPLEEPTVLLVAEGERLAPALAARLKEHGIALETAAPETVGQIAFAAAPDLIVLAGKAADDGGAAVLERLAERAVTSSLPVALIRDEETPRATSSFRHGVVATIARSASADAMARRIAEVAHEIPDRSGETSGTLAPASVDELIELFAESLRSGILAVRRGEDGPSAQIVLRADSPAEEVIGQLVEGLRPLIASSEEGPLRYEFHESSPSRISSLDVGDESESSSHLLQGRRVLVVEQSAARSDLLGQELRSAGALVVVADGAGHGLELARDLMPEVAIVDGSGVEGWAIDALRRIRHDLRLRWASLLLVDSEKLWRDPRRPEIALLAGPVSAQVQLDRELAERAGQARPFETRLELVGPIRALRALMETRLGLRLTVRHPRVIVELDLTDGLVAGATAREPRGREPVAVGAAALTVLFGLSTGRIHIAPAEAPRTANLMAPLDDAIAASARETPVIAPSIPPPSMPPDAKSRAPATLAPEDVGGLVDRLENLLEELRGASLAPPPPTAAASDPAASPAARPSELPSFGQPEESDTGHYDPELVGRLRSRMRRSSSRIAAVREDSFDEAPTLQRPAVPRPAVPKAALPPPPKAAIPPPSRARRARRSPTLVLGSAAADSAQPEAGPTVAKPLPKPGRPLPPPGPPAAASSSARADADSMDELAASPPLPPPSEAAQVLATPDGGGSASTKGAPESAGHASSPESALPFASGVAKGPPADGIEAGGVAAPTNGSPAGPEAEGPSAAAPGETAEPFLDPPPPPLFGRETGAPGDLADPSPASALEPDTARPLASPADPRAHRGEAERPAPAEAVHPSDAWASDPSADGSAQAVDDALGRPDLAPVALPRRAGLGLKIGLAATPVLLALIGSGVWLAMRQPESEPEVVASAEEPTPDTAPAAAPEPEPPREEPPAAPEPEPPREEPAAAPEPEPAPAEEAPPQATPPAGAPIGPGPGDPIEGRPEDFDLAALGIEPVPRPSSRRVLRARIRRQLREANRARNHEHDLDAADQLYRVVLGMDPENGRATAGLTRVYLERNDTAHAILFAQQLVRLHPEYASNYVLLGDTLLAGHNPEAAERAFAAAVALQPDWAPARERLASMGEP